LEKSYFKTKLFRKKLRLNTGYVKNMKKLLLSKVRMTHFVEEYVFNDTQQSRCTVTLFSFQNTRHCRDKKLLHTHEHTHTSPYVKIKMHQFYEIIGHTHRECVKNKPDVINNKPDSVGINGILRGIRIYIFTSEKN
jgi:hypothetical protein